jgi:mRNA-degrading endonuclease RelE of RelBE toxin-antitoxin system
MQFRISDTFTKALCKLNAQEQSATKITVFDLQQDPANPGLKFHRIDKSKDQNFWSIRVSRDIRVIIHKTESSFLICYTDHHDDAYKWAARRRIETHPKTGAAQIVEVRERIEEISIPIHAPTPHLEVFKEPRAPSADEKPLAQLFSNLSEDDLSDVGVPLDWLTDVKSANEDQFFEIAEHIPSEAAEALLQYAGTGILEKPIPGPLNEDPFDHPDAQRRFRIMEDMEELSRALDYPWEQWTVFLHPSQREPVLQKFKGPARVSGSAGTGKTVVALHRAARILRNEQHTKILLTTFSSPLAHALEHKINVLTNAKLDLVSRVTVSPFDGVAEDLFVLVTGHKPLIAKPDFIEGLLKSFRDELGLNEFTDRFLVSEWTHVVDGWQLDTFPAYRDVPRLGRKNRMGSKQREKVWPIFDATRAALSKKQLFTWPTVFNTVADAYTNSNQKPFDHIIVDEAQDLGVPELRMLAAIARDQSDALFFAGDLGQRIFQEPFSWLALGVDIRGRSSTLRVNYRTSHQIRDAVDRLLPPSIRDVDGNEEYRDGTVSVFNGPKPTVILYETEENERLDVAKWIVMNLKEGLDPEEIGIFVRSSAELARARAVTIQLDSKIIELSDRIEDRTGRISIGTMHLAKGLEFKAVAVMACDDDVLPSQERIETAVDEMDLDQVFETERHLFYVACTRARDRLLVTGVKPASEFFDDLEVYNGCLKKVTSFLPSDQQL